MNRTAWIYVRESTEEQLSGHSPETQERECRTLASRLGYNVTNVEWESGTARSMRERKVWQHINRAMRQHKMDAIIVYAYSRLHRNFMNQVEMLAAAKRAGVEVLSATEYADPANKSSKMLVYMAAMFNEMESDTIRERTMGGTRTRALRGMPLVGKKAPYGYQWVTRQDTSSVTGASRARKVALEPHPVEADRLRAIFAYLDAPNASDRSLSDVVNWLNAQGWPSPQGRLWRKTTVRYLINQPLYWGQAVAFRTAMTEVATTDEQTGEVELVKRPRLRAPAEQIPVPAVNAPALVDVALAERIHARLTARQTHRASSSRLLKRDEYWLRGGLLRCGICGGSLSPRRRTGRQGFYACAAGPSHPAGDTRHHQLTVARADAESFAIACVFRLALDSSQAEAALRQLAERHDEAGNDRAVAEQELAEVERKLTTMTKLAMHLSEGEMSEFAAQFAGLRDQRQKWQNRLAALQASASHTERLVDMLQQVVGHIRAHLASPSHLANEAHRANAAQATPQADDLAGDLAWLRAQAGKPAGAPVEGGILVIGQGVQVQEWRQALQALGAHIVVTPGRQGGREGWRRLRLEWPLDGPPDTPPESAPDGGPVDGAEAGERDGAGPDGVGANNGSHSVQMRSGFWPVAVSASHASSTPTISCWA